MTDRGRETFMPLDDGARIRYRRSEAPPPYRYAITLEVQAEGGWAEIALWDNAHDIDEHHKHEYTQAEGKLPPTVLEYESTNEAMAAAIGKATSEWRTILSRWGRSE